MDSAKIFYRVERILSTADNRKVRERAAVGDLLEKIAGHPVELCHTADGAPYLKDSDLCISISHSRHYVAVAWSERGRFGIDIEENRNAQLERVAPRTMSVQELDFYRSRPDGLLQAWTLKEASFKALRGGPADLKEYKLPLSADDKKIIMNDGSETLTVVESAAIAPGVFLSIVCAD